MSSILQDLRFAFRVLRRAQGFTITALLTIAIGIGATTAVFSIVYGVLLRPLPYPAADRLVRLSEEHPGAVSPLREAMLSNLTFYQWQQSARTIEEMATYRYAEMTAELSDGSVRLTGVTVTPSLFPLLGIAPAHGRLFEPREGAKGADHVVVLSDHLWHERFGADLAAIGRTIVMDGERYEVVGVAPAGFAFPNRDTAFWIPTQVPPPAPDAVAGGRGSMTVMDALARLKPGATPARAAAEGTAAARATVRPMAANLLFGTGGPVVVHVRSVVGEMTSQVRPAILVLGAGVLLLLLIACANVANLFLARGYARQRELSVRAAIGAGRNRLARQLLSETALVSLAGSVAGVFVAWALVRLVPRLASADFPRLDQIGVDGRVLAFAALAAVFATLMAGLAPALHGARFDLAASLHGGDGASAGGFRDARGRRLRQALLVAEATFAILLLVGAALLGHSFERLVHVDAGYTPEHVLTARTFVPGGGADDKGPAMNALVLALVERVRGLPGVVAVGAGNMAPLSKATLIAGFPAPGELESPKPRRARALLYTITPGYAEALDLRLRAGRLFTTADLNSGIRPWIVNEEFARLYLPSNPVGFQFPWKDAHDHSFTAEIVGVVGNVLKDGNDRRPQPELYEPPRDQQRFRDWFFLVVRATGDPAASANAVRALVHELAPAAAIETATLSQQLSRSVDEPRFATAVLVAFAMVALALACVGLYGVISYSVSQRRREFGVRAALGAERGALLAMVVREGLAIVAVGIALGLAGAVAVTRLMQSALFGVTPLDPISFAMAPVILLLVATAACLIPARRAANVDPAEALRSE